jgi:PIN like domain
MNVYIDENLPPQLADGLDILEKPRNLNIKVLSIRKAFHSGCLDEEWIPVVGEEEAIVITQDRNIHRRSSQRELYEKFGVGLYIMIPPSKKGYSYWEMVTIIINNWEEIIQRGLRKRRPFTYILKPKGKMISLDGSNTDTN